MEWKGRYFEIGIGSFGNSPSKQNKKGKVVYEGFGGVGFAGIRNRYDADMFNVKYMNVFLQGSLAYSAHWIDIALTPRLMYMHYTDKSYSFTEAGSEARADAFFNKNKSKLLFEPGFTIRLGYKNMKVHINYVKSSFDPKITQSDGEEFEVENDFVSVGLNYVFTKRFRE